MTVVVMTMVGMVVVMSGSGCAAVRRLWNGLSFPPPGRPMAHRHAYMDNTRTSRLWVGRGQAGTGETQDRCGVEKRKQQYKQRREGKRSTGNEGLINNGAERERDHRGRACRTDQAHYTRRKGKEDNRSSCDSLPRPCAGAAAGTRLLPSPAPSGAANWGGEVGGGEGGWKLRLSGQRCRG
ncbi:hypothetical protein E2C01_013446 [Portunus trituberculatus]|uniref:Secreted protein n=1 Tax=Portunus trituberculatus TaxID=210409 RepID=A0A5B7DGN4_PORTR|nr:hypothetical protein [Portunus trituberculatus]